MSSQSSESLTMNMLVLSTIMVSILVILFFMVNKKELWEKESSSSFECGFTSYFYSRFSFSIHFFLVGLIFLFLDLELCFIMPFFNEELASWNLGKVMLVFVLVILVGLIQEWKEGKLEWKF